MYFSVIFIENVARLLGHPVDIPVKTEVIDNNIFLLFLPVITEVIDAIT